MDVVSIKNAILAFLKQSGQNVATLREKEWIGDEIRRLEKQGKLSGPGGASQIKPTGIVRKMDELGRVVIPKELRNIYGIGDRDPVEMYVDPITKFICIQKHEQQCHFCSNNKDITEFKGKFICEECIGEFAKEVLGLE